MKGAIPVAGLERVVELLGDDAGEVQIELRFRASASGVPRLQGSVRLPARLECQRCLKPLDLELHSEFRISFTDGDEGSGRAELSAGYEPLESGKRVGLTTIVEDEILLALPDFPMHPPEACTATGEAGAGEPGSTPFSGLRSRLEQSRT